MSQFKSNSNSDQTGKKKKLLDQVREVIRAKHYSHRTEEAYIQWLKRFIFYHNKRHPAEMGELEINQFLSHLSECLRLRVKDIDFGNNQIIARDGKGDSAPHHD